MNRIRYYLDKIMEWICIILFAFMIIIGTYQIVTRYVFNAPSTISEELLTYTFTWMALLAAAYVFGKRDHMRMAFFSERFSKKIQIILAIVSEVIIILFSSFVLIYGGFSITTLTMTQQSASLGIPKAYVYFVLPVSGIVTVIYNIMNIIDLSSNLKNLK